MSAPPIAKIPELDALDIELVTEHLRLRPLVDTDVEVLWPYVSDPNLSRQMTWAAHTDREQTHAFVAAMAAARTAGTDLVWAIEHDGRAAGCIGLHGIRWRVGACRMDRAELGYWLGTPLWGRGLMTEAATAVVHFAFVTMGLHKVTTAHFITNAASRRVIEKLGFRLTGRCDEDLFRDGRWHGHLRYELLTDDPVDLALTQPIARQPPPR